MSPDGVDEASVVIVIVIDRNRDGASYAPELVKRGDEAGVPHAAHVQAGEADGAGLIDGHGWGSACVHDDCMQAIEFLLASSTYIVARREAAGESPQEH